MNTAQDYIDQGYPVIAPNDRDQKNWTVITPDGLIIKTDTHAQAWAYIMQHHKKHDRT